MGSEGIYNIYIDLTLSVLVDIVRQYHVQTKSRAFDYFLDLNIFISCTGYTIVVIKIADYKCTNYYFVEIHYITIKI